MTTTTAPVRVKAAPNPTSAPPLDPVWVRKLERIADRIGAPLRWHFMSEDFTYGAPQRCWSIQQRMPRGWQTVFIAYDETKRWEGNAYPFQQIDDNILREFCESSLRIKYNTGDEDKDVALNDAALDEINRTSKARQDQRGLEKLHAVITGGDARRFGRLMQHESMHNGPGVRFTEFFPGANLKANGDE